jgi:aspartate/methionine/tyrosine aminotransferase
VPRLVHTPWSEEPLPFAEAAEIGTRKVMTEHATLAMLVTADGSFGEIPREDYLDAEERVAKELLASHVPFAVILNSATPESEETRALAYALEEKYNAPVALLSCPLMDAEDIRRCISPRTKAIVLTSPNNPTGCVYTKETLDAVHEVLKDLPVFVLCDDVYRTLIYTQDYHSFAEYTDMRDRIIVIQSFSKSYSMTGWRLGYCMADASVKAKMQLFHQYGVVSVPSFVQNSCIIALESDTEPTRQLFLRRRDYVYDRLCSMGLSVQKPEGAFYILIDFRAYDPDSLHFCTRLLQEGLVGLVPGCYFGAEGFARLSYCYSDEELKIGLDRLERFLSTL